MEELLSVPQYLVIQLARFGDLVQTKRLVHTLAQRGQVHLCVDTSLAGLVPLLYPQATAHLLPVHGRPNAEALALTRATCAALQSLSFDAVYNLNHAGFNRVMARLFEPDQVRGHAMHGPQHVPSPWVRQAFLRARHRTLAPLNLVDFWAHLDICPVPPQDVNPVAQGQGRGLGVVLAGRESRRSLPPALLASCVHTAFEALGGVDVFLLGSAGEKPLARQLLRLLPGHMLSRVQDLSGKTSWQGLADALTGLDALLSPDTGTMHLAAHLGVPVQAFFLSSALCHETGPYGAGHTVWQSAFECAPCLESAPCGLDTACLRAFEGRALLRGLALSLRDGAALGGAHHDWPEHLLCCTSALDALGSYFQVTAGHDAQEERRLALRRLVGENVGAGVAGDEHLAQGAGPRPEVLRDEELLSLVLEDSHWMLPAPSRRFA